MNNTFEENKLPNMNVVLNSVGNSRVRTDTDTVINMVTDINITIHIIMVTVMVTGKIPVNLNISFDLQ